MRDVFTYELYIAVLSLPMKGGGGKESKRVDLVPLPSTRIGPNIRQERSRISGNIRQGMPGNPAGYLASGKKNKIRPNPSY